MTRALSPLSWEPLPPPHPSPRSACSQMDILPSLLVNIVLLKSRSPWVHMKHRLQCMAMLLAEDNSRLLPHMLERLSCVGWLSTEEGLSWPGLWALGCHQDCLIPKSGLVLSEAAFSKDSISSGFMWRCDTLTSYETSSNHLKFASLFIKFGPGQWDWLGVSANVPRGFTGVHFCIGARRISVICLLFSVFYTSTCIIVIILCFSNSAG